MRSSFGVLLILVATGLKASAQPVQLPEYVSESVSSDGTRQRIVTIAVSDIGPVEPAFRQGVVAPNLTDFGAGLPVRVRFTNATTTTPLTVRIVGTDHPIGPGVSVELGPEQFGPSAVPRRFEFTVAPQSAPQVVASGFFAFGSQTAEPTVAGSSPTPASVPASVPAPAATAAGAQATQSRAAPTRNVTTTAPTQTGGQPAGVAPLVSDTRHVTRVQLDGTGVRAALFRNLRNPPYLLAGTPDTDPEREALIMRFEGRLRASVSTDTARNEITGELKTIDSGPAGRQLLARVAFLDESVLEFINESLDRTFSVVMDVPLPLGPGPTPLSEDKAREAFRQESGYSLGSCGGTPTTCKLVLNLPYNTPKRVRASVFIPVSLRATHLHFLDWARYLKESNPPIAFSVNFFDENATPAEPRGYFTLVPRPQVKEQASSTGWMFSPTISVAREPLVRDSDSFGTTADTQYAGSVRRQFAGATTLQLSQSLGARADATVAMAFKGGALGEKDQSGAVKVSTYQVNVNSVPGFRLSFGKFLFAAPAGGIAIREAGEGYRIDYAGRVSAAHIIKRESVDGTADTDNHDSQAFVVEVKNLAPKSLSAVRSINLTASGGFDRARATERQYFTVGGDSTWAVPDTPLSGTLALYHSRRRPNGDLTDPRIVRGRGTVGLVSLGYQIFEKTVVRSDQIRLKPLASIRLDVASGTGDNFDRTDTDTGYLGETAVFAPDSSIFSKLAPRLADVGPRISGLKNKNYVATVYQDERFTLFDIVTGILKIPDVDVSSRLTRLTGRVYYFHGSLTEARDAREGAMELLYESQIETPAGVRSKLTIGYFRAGEALRPWLVKRSAWSIVASTTVTLGS